MYDFCVRHKFLVSTDIVGILGRREDWEYIWADYINDKNFGGFEMIGWSWGERFLNSRFKYRVTGIHGKTAGWSEGRGLIGKTMLWSLNFLFFSFNKLTSLGALVDYVLIHRGALTEDVETLLIKNKENLNLVCIENDLVQNSFSKTLKKIEKLREQGVNAGLMFDLVHFLRETNRTEPNLKRWDLLLEALKDIKTLTIPVSFHFPIGLYSNDSLPISQFTDEMWQQLSFALNKIDYRYLVLENQAPRRYSLLLTRKDKLYFRKRTSDVYSLLKKHKII